MKHVFVACISKQLPSIKVLVNTNVNNVKFNDSLRIRHQIRKKWPIVLYYECYACIIQQNASGQFFLVIPFL